MNASYKQSDLVPTSLVRRVSFHRKDPGYASVPGRLLEFADESRGGYRRIPTRPAEGDMEEVNLEAEEGEQSTARQMAQRAAQSRRCGGPPGGLGSGVVVAGPGFLATGLG